MSRLKIDAFCMKSRIKPILLRVGLVCAVSTLLTGCIAPGMHMASVDYTKTVNRAGKIVRPGMTKINADFIKTLELKIAIDRKLAAENYAPPTGFYSNTAQYQYEIGPNDILNIIVWDHPNLSNPKNSYNIDPVDSGLVVDQQGYIYYPYVGKVKAAGLTTNQLRQRLTQKLSMYIKDPQLNVRVVKFDSQKIYVTGSVTLPVSIPLNDSPLTVVGAIQAAKGPVRCGLQSSSGVDQRLCANLEHVKVTQDGHTTTVNLDNLTAPNGSSTNWVLQNNAHVYVPNNNYRVFVLGAVTVPGPYNIINDSMNLAQAIGDASGVSNTSDPTYTYIIRNFHRDPSVYWLDMRSPDAFNLASEFPLKAGDVVFVSTSLLESMSQVMNEVNPLILNAVNIQSLRQSIQTGP